MVPALHIEGLTKQRGERLILDQVGLTVPRGTVVGLLGTNGSGKTTLMRCVAGLTSPTGGTIELFGLEMPSNRAEVAGKVSALIERPTYYAYLNAEQNLWILGRTSGIAESHLSARIPRLLSEVGLSGQISTRPMREFSEGQRQRWGLAAVRLGAPELFVLDEPTNGLDAVSRLEQLRKVKDLSASGAAVLFTSHTFTEVQHVCSRVAVLDGGRILWDGPLAQLPQSYADAFSSS